MSYFHEQIFDNMVWLITHDININNFFRVFILFFVNKKESSTLFLFPSKQINKFSKIKNPDADIKKKSNLFKIRKTQLTKSNTAYVRRQILFCFRTLFMLLVCLDVKTSS